MANANRERNPLGQRDWGNISGVCGCIRHRRLLDSSCWETSYLDRDRQCGDLDDIKTRFCPEVYEETAGLDLKMQKLWQQNLHCFRWDSSLYQ